MNTNESLADLEFPLGGIDVSTEFQEQPPGTTPVAVNVRATDPATLRERGGSRMGIDHYVPQVPAGAHLIQHLNVIVDPQATRLPQNTLTPEPDWLEDPLIPGHYYPPGGWGVQPNPNAIPPSNPSATLAFEQSFVEGFPATIVEETAGYSTTPGGGGLMLAVVATLDASTNATVTVTNAAGNAYTQIGSYVRRAKLGSQMTLSLWQRVASAGASEIDVKVLPSQSVTMVVAGLEFSGQNAVPIDSTNSNSGNADPMTTGAITVDLGTECVVAAFLAALAPDTVTLTAGFTLQIDHNDGTGDMTDLQLYVGYDLARAAGSLDVEANFAGGADEFAAMVVELKD